MSAMVAMLAGCGGGSNTPRTGVTAERTRPDVTYSVLYSFKGAGGPGDGKYPLASLINVKGTLYGTTVVGGAECCGTVFSMTQSGKESVLHSFAEGDGDQPLSSLINLKGMLYTTTLSGGASGAGTVFSVTPSGLGKVLYSFRNGSGDGKNPHAGLLNVNGALYGTTEYGGANSDGTVFAIRTSGKETVLHSFGGSGDGAYPYAGLINVNGTLYGTTAFGGAGSCEVTYYFISYSGCGTVFSITTSGTETVLYSFKDGSGDGKYPYASLLNVDDTFYGTTFNGGANGYGTVFAVTTSGTETALYSFKGGSADGENPRASLINVNDTLYGTTVNGGANGDGTVFAITTSGTETVLHGFKGKRGGAEPFAGLLNVNGTLYGTTKLGGTHGKGTVFTITP